VSRSTKLFQQAGSPLIQGHSKLERAFLGEWLMAVVAAMVLGVLGIWVWFAAASGSFSIPSGEDVWAVVQATFVAYAPGAVVGSVSGTTLARGLGMFRHWHLGALGGALGGAVSVVLLAHAAASILGI